MAPVTVNNRINLCINKLRFAHTAGTRRTNGIKCSPLPYYSGNKEYFLCASAGFGAPEVKCFVGMDDIVDWPDAGFFFFTFWNKVDMEKHEGSIQNFHTSNQTNREFMGML